MTGMSRDTAVGLVGRPASRPGRVREVAVPPAARALRTLSRVDYEDAFVLETGRAQDRTAEEWTRAMLEGAPAATRRALRFGWFALGARLGPTGSDRHVLGWELRRSSPDVALLAASSRLGLRAEVLLMRRQRSLLVATFVQLGNPIARAVWVAGVRGHRRAVPQLLARAGRSQPRRSAAT